MCNAELIVPMTALRSQTCGRWRIAVFQLVLAVLQPPRAQIPLPVHHIQVVPRRLQHPGEYRHISLGLFALHCQRRTSIPILLRRIAPHQIAVQGLAGERQLLQPVRIQPRQRPRSLNYQLLQLRTSAALSHLPQAIAPFAPVDLSQDYDWPPSIESTTFEATSDAETL